MGIGEQARVAVQMNRKLFEFAGFFGATRRIRTDDLLITNFIPAAKRRE
jgi:hypothetical protein